MVFKIGFRFFCVVACFHSYGVQREWEFIEYDSNARPREAAVSETETAQKEENSAEAEDIQEEVFEKGGPQPLRFAALFSIRQDIGKGIGYNKGYTTLEEQIFFNFKERIFPFFDVRIHRFLNARYAGNGGLGFRIKNDRYCKLFGANAYYDYRSISGVHFSQIGGGLEVLDDFWGLRLNGYFPFGKMQGETCSNLQTVGDFFLKRQDFEYAFTGFNLEGELKLGIQQAQFVLLGSPYYYHRKHLTDIIGGLIGLSFWYKQVFQFRISGTYDSVFKGRLQGLVGMSFPIGQVQDRAERCALSKRSLEEPVRRNEIIVTDSKTKWTWNY